MWPVSAGFIRALTASVRDVKMRVTALDSDLAVVRVLGAEALEATVYVDTERATRRTCQMRVINTNGEFTPLSSDDLFWWDKQFSVEYGLRVGAAYEYVPVGTFMVDNVEVLSERGVSVINIDGSDQWKKMTFSTFAAPTAWARYTTYNTIIADIASAAGVTLFNLDPLTERPATDREVQVPIFFESDDNRGEKLKMLCANWNLDIYFDVSGQLTTRSLTTQNAQIDAAPPVWTFSAGSEAIFLSLTKTKSGDSIKNHIVVTGEADDGTAVVRGEALDNDPASPTNIASIGDRVHHIRSQILRTTTACEDLAKSELSKHKLVSEDLNLPTIVVPQFEGRDVVRIVEPNSFTDDKYFLTSFDIPMRSSTQTIKVKKARSVNLATHVRSFTADARLVARVSGSFTGNSVLFKTIPATYTADAVLLKGATASYTANAVLRVTQTGTRTADSVLKATIAGSFTADAVLAATIAGSFTADAELV